MTDGPPNNQPLATRDAIRAILLHEWDPINVAGDCPDDEYDDYIDPVLVLLSDASKTELDIAIYLFNVKEKTMGLGGISAQHSARSMQHCHRIAAKLLELHNAPNTRTGAEPL